MRDSNVKGTLKLGGWSRSAVVPPFDVVGGQRRLDLLLLLKQRSFDLGRIAIDGTTLLASGIAVCKFRG